MQLTTLKQAGISRLYISIDGPRNEMDRNNQKLLYEIISKFKMEFSELNIRESEINQGIAVAMVSAIDWFFSKNNYGVIFEDDIEFNLDTLRFFGKALKNIANRPEILMVSGFQPFYKKSLRPQVEFTNYPQIWGWATHAFKWSQMRNFLFSRPLAPADLSREVRNFWRVGWQRVSEGYLDTWDLPIATGMIFSNKFCMLPPVNIISNIGADTHSTNTREMTFPIGLPIQEIQQEIDFDIEPVLVNVLEINTRFEKEMYFIGLKHLLTPLLKHLDRYRFSRKKKEAFLIRMSRNYQTRTETFG